MSDMSMSQSQSQALDLDADVSREASIVNPPTTQHMNGVIQNMKFTGVCLPIMLHSSAACDTNPQGTYPLDVPNFAARHLDTDFGSMQFESSANVFHASLFVPIECLDTTVAFWRFKYEDVGTDTVDNFRILYTVFTYTVAFLTRSRSKSRANLENPVEVLLEMIPAPGYDDRDWEEVGAEALLGYTIHAFVQVGDPVREVPVLDPEAVPEFPAAAHSDDEEDDLDDPDDDAGIRHYESELELLLSAQADIEDANNADIADADDDDDDADAFGGMLEDAAADRRRERKQAMAERKREARELKKQIRQVEKDLANRRKQLQQLARRRETERKQAHKRRVSEYKKQLRINKRERAAWVDANDRFRQFFFTDLLTAQGRVANVASAMIKSSHSYAPDACMCAALRLLSQGVVAKQHEQQMKLVQNVSNEVAKQKLFVDLLDQSSHHASVGVLVHTAKFVSAVEWYYSTDTDVAEMAVTSFSSADEALRNPNMDAGEFTGRIDLQAMRFQNIFDPTRAYEYAAAEYKRRSGGRAWNFMYDPTCPLELAGPAMRVDPSDVRLAAEPFAAIPPLTRYYYVHTVFKYARACSILRNANNPFDDMDDDRKAVVPQLCTLDALGSNSLRMYMGLQNCHLALQLFYEMEPRIRARIKNMVQPPTEVPEFATQFASRIRSLDFFNGIWSTSADHPPAVLAVIGYLDRRIRESGRRLYQYRLKFDSVEISAFGHYLETLCSGFDVLLGAHTTHRMLGLILCATRHVYSNNPNAFLHPHVLFRGGHGSGKSHAAKIVQRLLIPDTYVNADHTSAQALTFDGDNTNYMVMFQEEANMILADGGGVSQDGLQVASAATNNTKAMLSDRMVGVLRVMRNALGQLTKKYMMIENNNLFVGTTNAPKHRSNAAILDRLSCVQPITLAELTRFARPTAADSDALPLDPHVQKENEAARAEFLDFVRLMQALVCKVMFMQGTDGILLPFVDLSIVASFRVMLCHEDNPFLIVSNARAQRDELNKANRVFKRLNAICEVLTIERALVMMFFCPNSPFTRETEYSDKDLLAIAPLLYTNVEVLYAAIGLMCHEFIDEQAVTVLQAITRWMQRDVITASHCVETGMWKDYYKVDDFVAVRETEVRDGTDKISADKLEEMKRRRESKQQSNDSAGATAEASAGSGGEPIHRTGSIMEYLSAGLRQQAIERRSKQVISEFQLRPEDLIDDNARPPPQSEHKMSHNSHYQQQQQQQHGGVGQVAREQMDKSRLKNHADRTLFQIVKADKQVLMSDDDIRDTLQRLRHLRLMKSVERSVMAVSFDDVEPCLYVHKDVYHTEDPVTTLFGIVDKVLSMRIKKERVVVSTVPVSFEPGTLQRRLLKPDPDAKLPFIPNPQFVKPRHTRRFNLNYTEQKQTLGIKMSADFDVAAIVHCLKSLGLHVTEDMKAPLIFRKLLDGARQINLPVTPIEQLQQTCELFGVDPLKLHMCELPDVYYLQHLTLQCYDSLHRTAVTKLGSSPFASASLSERHAEFQKLLLEAMRAKLESMQVNGKSVFAAAVQPCIDHYNHVVYQATALLQNAPIPQAEAVVSRPLQAEPPAASRRFKRPRALVNGSSARPRQTESLFEDEDEDEDDEWNNSDFDQLSPLRNPHTILPRPAPAPARAPAARLAPPRLRLLDAVRDFVAHARQPEAPAPVCQDVEMQAASVAPRSRALPDVSESDLFSSLSPP